MFKELYKQLQKELLVAHKRLHASRFKSNHDTSKTRLTYEKLQAIRQRQPTAKIEEQLKELESSKVNYPPLDSSKVRDLMGQEGDLHNLQNVVMFLKNQRVYNELLERYNPGLTMSQEDNVRKTANMVGLAVPE